jgi:hypothetical protein
MLLDNPLATVANCSQRMPADDVVRMIRIPRDLYERIRVWSERRDMTPPILDAIRYVLEHGMKDLERRESK